MAVLLQDRTNGGRWAWRCASRAGHALLLLRPDGKAAAPSLPQRCNLKLSARFLAKTVRMLSTMMMTNPQETCLCWWMMREALLSVGEFESCTCDGT